MDNTEDKLLTYSEMFKALSHPTRLNIVRKLFKKPEGMTVTTIQQHMGISQSSVSQHLRILKQYNILMSQRSGTQINYRLENEDVEELMTLLIKLA